LHQTKTVGMLRWKSMDQGGINPTSREIARQLLAYESVEPGTSVDGPLAIQVCDKLRQQMATLMGHAAFQSLLGRALTLAKREAGNLEDVKVKENGSLEGLNAGTDGAGLVIIASLVALLVTFVGHSLTLRLLHDVWPALAGTDSNLTGSDQ
jgi:hypothetical protein